jgi:glyoxylase-like metal-dependent hydrolase (beta-lactamase superfamily II)
VLRQLSDGVWIHESEFVQSNATVVRGRHGVLLIDAGVHVDEMICLTDDISALGMSVVAGFSTHPHWDHLLWHARFGDVPRYGTTRCAATVSEELSNGIEPSEHGIPELVPLDLLGLISGLPVETRHIPWDGSQVRILEHQAHAPGHAALLVEECGVLVAGDMLSDILIPLLHVDDTADPIENYLLGLTLLESVAGEVDFVIPGHGSVGDAAQLAVRCDQDRAYVQGLRDASEVSDPRFSIEYCKEWLPGVHAQQVLGLAQRRERRANSD